MRPGDGGDQETPVPHGPELHVIEKAAAGDIAQDTHHGAVPGPSFVDGLPRVLVHGSPVAFIKIDRAGPGLFDVHGSDVLGMRRSEIAALRL